MKYLTAPALLCAFATVFAPNIAIAQETAEVSQAAESSPLESRADDTVKLINGELNPQDVFSASFLAAVPPAQFEVISQQLQSQFGPVVGVESLEAKGDFTGDIALRFEKAIGRGTISIEPQEPFLITGLVLTSFDQLNDDTEKISADLESLPGDVSAYFGPLDGGAPIFVSSANQHLAIGSTFKLYVLSALARSIEAGERAWSDTLTIDRRSFPSGQMQRWPSGAPATLQTLATMMISISDNTATDILIQELGRDAVEAELELTGHSDPARTKPFLTTLEMFALKGSPDNATKYIAGDEATRRAILADFEDDIGGDPSKLDFPSFTTPTEIDTLEWFANADDLRSLLRVLANYEDPTARQIMAVSPSVAENELKDWAYAGYKGGSEPGVLNLTWLLQDKSEGWHILTLSWNNTEAPLANAQLEVIARRILALAR